MKRSFIAFLLATATLAASASVAQAAAPRIVIISGKPLASQIVISDWEGIFTIVNGSAGARPASRALLANRSRMMFWMFWGPQWNEYLSSGKSAKALRPRQADQVGGFYPAWHGRPALIDLPWAGEWPRLLSAKALAILQRSGVPIRLA